MNTFFSHTNNSRRSHCPHYTTTHQSFLSRRSKRGRGTNHQIAHTLESPAKISLSTNFIPFWRSLMFAAGRRRLKFQALWPPSFLLFRGGERARKHNKAGQDRAIGEASPNPFEQDGEFCMWTQRSRSPAPSERKHHQPLFPFENPAPWAPQQDLPSSVV